jgi:hypothetical protein
MEETGSMAVVRSFAGTYSYLKNGQPKVVLIWHMLHCPEPYAKQAPPEEIGEVAWLTLEEALDKLTHPGERDFVASHERPVPSPNPIHRTGMNTPELQRLSAAIMTVRNRFGGYKRRPNPHASLWWVDCAEHALTAADEALGGKDCNGAWGALHDAERFLVLGMTHEELLTRAVTLQEETQAKLKGWRMNATARLFGFVAFAEWIKSARPLKVNEHSLLQEVVLEALGVLQEESNNKYHRLRLVRKQLQFLVMACAAVLIATLVLSFRLADPGGNFAIKWLGPIILAGALGGVVSGMFQLSRVGRAKIPEALLHGLITSGRPVMGAACALFLYVVMRSNITSLIAADKMTFETALVLGFVAGFSERFVLSTVSKVTGNESKERTNVLSGAILRLADENLKSSGMAPSNQQSGNLAPTGKAQEAASANSSKPEEVKQPGTGP